LKSYNKHIKNGANESSLSQQAGTEVIQQEINEIRSENNNPTNPFGPKGLSLDEKVVREDD